MKERGYKTLLERDRRFELPLPVWKTGVLAADTNPAYMVLQTRLELVRFCPRDFRTTPCRHGQILYRCSLDYVFTLHGNKSRV